MMKEANDFRRAVEAMLAMAENPPRVTAVDLEQYSWYGTIEVTDGPIVWRFVCEQSVLALEAAPFHSSEDFFDADLLRRKVLGAGYERVDGYPDNSLSEASLSALSEQFRELRPSLASMFDESAWRDTRVDLVRLGHVRDYELFGRPLPENLR